MMCGRNILLASVALVLVGCSSMEIPKVSMPKMPSMPKMSNVWPFKKSPEPESAIIEKHGGEYYGDPSGAPISQSEAERKRARKLYKTVIVQEADTIYTIAERYNLESRDIIEFNDLRPPYSLNAGEMLKLPRPQFHAVQHGESLYDISRQRGVDMSLLAKLNKIPAPYAVEPGTRLRLPFRTHAATGYGFKDGSGGVETGEIEVSDLGDMAPAGTAKKGNKYQPRKIRYVLEQPDGRKVSVERSDTKEEIQEVEVASLPSSSRQGRQGAEEPEEVISAPVRPLKSSTPVKKNFVKSGPVPEPRGRPPENFSWPVKGKVIAGFGPKRGGMHNDGINIAAPVGTSVKAAADGVVIYAGDGLEGYGNLLIIKHSGGWITSYAHNKELLVRRGDKVRRGQAIAKVGETGRVERPQLHFGVRKGRDVVDPTRYLSS